MNEEEMGSSQNLCLALIGTEVLEIALHHTARSMLPLLAARQLPGHSSQLILSKTEFTCTRDEPHMDSNFTNLYKSVGHAAVVSYSGNKALLE